MPCGGSSRRERQAVAIEPGCEFGCYGWVSQGDGVGAENLALRAFEQGDREARVVVTRSVPDAVGAAGVVVNRGWPVPGELIRPVNNGGIGAERMQMPAVQLGQS